MSNTQYHLFVNPGEEYTAGYTTTPTKDTLPAPEGFDPAKNAARIEPNGELTLVPIEEFEAQEEERRKYDAKKAKGSVWSRLFR